MKFLALNVDFSSSSPDPLDSRRSAQAGVKHGYTPKSGYFTAQRHIEGLTKGGAWRARGARAYMGV